MFALAEHLKHSQLSSTTSNPVASVMGEFNILQAAADAITEQEPRLKNLASMQVKIVRMFMWFIKLFLYVKKLSGPFKPVIEMVERIFRRLILLVLEKVFHVPAELLKLVDIMAGGSATKFDSFVPPVIGQVSSGAISAVEKVAGLAGGVATEVQSAGLLSSASGLFKKVSSDAISTVQNAPQVAAGLATKVQGAKVRNEEEEQWLKYLAFVQVITLYAVLCITNLYVYAKERSGPLKPIIKFVEGIVKKVFRFVFDKSFDVLVKRLKSGDPTVGEFVIKIDGLVHPGINQVSSEVVSAAQKVAGVAGDVYTEVHNVGAGVVNAASGIVKQVSSDAITGALKAPGVLGGLVSEVQHAGEVSSEAISSTLKGPIIAGGVVAQLQSGVGGIASGLIKQVSSEAISPVVGESVTKIDNLVPSLLKQVSSEAGLATEAQPTGLLSTTSGLIKHVSSEAASTVQKAAGVAEGVATEVQHAGILKQVASDAISAVHNAPVLAGGVATELPHLGLLSTASGLVKQVSSDAASTVQKAAGVAEGVASEVQHVGILKQVASDAISAVHNAPVLAGGVATDPHLGLLSTASGLVKQVSSDAASTAQKAPGFPFGRRF